MYLNFHWSTKYKVEKFLVGFFALSFMLSMTIQPLVFSVSAGHDPFNGVEQTSVLFCHKLGNGSYNQPNSSVTATGGQVNVPQGHASHLGDIIPPFHFEGGSYAGQNWTEENEDIWNSGLCNGPVATPEPTPTPTDTPADDEGTSTGGTDTVVDSTDEVTELPQSGILDNILRVSIPGAALLLIGIALKLLL